MLHELGFWLKEVAILHLAADDHLANVRGHHFGGLRDADDGARTDRRGPRGLGPKGGGWRFQSCQVDTFDSSRTDLSYSSMPPKAISLGRSR
jgi:hypothetical protein